MRFDDLATRWDEAVPLGNGMVGALVWQEGDVVRLSLDRADLWDERPVENFEKPEFRFQWMLDQINKGDIGPVQELIDRPYDKEPGPTKIPAARLEFDQSSFGNVQSVELDPALAICTVQWDSGVQLETFVHAKRPFGCFRLTNLKTTITPIIVPPPFGGDPGDLSNINSLNTPPLSALGYDDPVVKTSRQSAVYTQKGWGDFEFMVRCDWAQRGKTLEGVWTVLPTNRMPDPLVTSRRLGASSLMRGYQSDKQSHVTWWRNYWNQSNIEIPDDVLEKHWYLEQYKFGSASRRGAPPITLQAVWTADEQRTPPWKGDYHNDLNTQLSYWPCYSANHLDEGMAFLDWLWKIKPANEKFTQLFYGHSGLNVPGTTTLDGDAMGGWNQYSFSPTTSAWLAHHFYLHWRYSMDKQFLKASAYPYIRSVIEFLDQHSVLEDGVRRLPLSSSPEINDNRIDAWFKQTTNYDLALIRWVYSAGIEMAEALGNFRDAEFFRDALNQWPQLARAKDDGRLLVAPEYPLHDSHRHFSHLMAFHPLGLVDMSNGEEDAQTIKASLKRLEELGPDWWCGYSYAWVGNMYARAFDGEKAAQMLRDFAQCFTSINTFHLNGDQTKSGKSKFQYRPFTLEGNFAFAAGVQEMLLQSHTGVIRVFPAVPDSWKDASFKTLRAEGAFLVSAKREGSVITEIDIESEKGGLLSLYLPEPGSYKFSGGVPVESNHKDRIAFKTSPGDRIQIRNSKRN